MHLFLGKAEKYGGAAYLGNPDDPKNTMWSKNLQVQFFSIFLPLLFCTGAPSAKETEAGVARGGANELGGDYQASTP